MLISSRCLCIEYDNFIIIFIFLLLVSPRSDIRSLMDKVLDHSSNGLSDSPLLQSSFLLLRPLLLRQERVDVLWLQGQVEVAGEVAPEA